MVLHAFVPIGAGGSGQEGHMITSNALPNGIDPLAGWQDMGETYFEVWLGPLAPQFVQIDGLNSYYVTLRTTVLSGSITAKR
jgi:hypothetical protein